MVQRFHQLAKEKNEKYAHSIEKDVGRTFGITDPSFAERLARVLHAYANHNPTVGYQCLNFFFFFSFFCFLFICLFVCSFVLEQTPLLLKD
jgi:hypothetical protein